MLNHWRYFEYITYLTAFQINRIGSFLENSLYEYEPSWNTWLPSNHLNESEQKQKYKIFDAVEI